MRWSTRMNDKSLLWIQHSSAPLNNQRPLHQLLPKGVQKNRATWPLRGIRIHINKAKLKITNSNVEAWYLRQRSKQWEHLPKIEQFVSPKLKKKKLKKAKGNFSL